jgi:hypothetical protein
MRKRNRMEGIVMRRRVTALGLSIAVSLFMGLLVVAQSRDDAQEQRLDETWRRIISDPVPEKYVSSLEIPPCPNWKQITDDLGLCLTLDQWGERRGTLFVRIDSQWEAVALEGPSELGPRVLPAVDD